MKALSAPAPLGPDDDELRARIGRKFERVAEQERLPAILTPPSCCGGRGLVVGCPICERRWPS